MFRALNGKVNFNVELLNQKMDLATEQKSTTHKIGYIKR